MAILAGLGAALGRFAGQILNTTLGWATLLLFGKVPQSRQIYLLVIVFGSLVWVVLVIGVVVPAVGTLLLSGVSLPAFIDLGWIRLAMLVGALLLPAVIGALAIFVAEKGSRPAGFGIVAGVLRGYPFAAVLSLVMIVLALVASLRKLRSMAKRWEDAHIPIIVKPGAYDRVLQQLSSTLKEAGLDHQVRDAGTFISGPPKLLDLVAGRALGSLVPDRLALLVGDNFEALIYPSDVAITGSRLNVARLRAAVSAKLVDVPAYMTTSAEAQHFEDELAKAETIKDLRRLDAQLATLTVPHEEWEVLYRQRLQVELQLLGHASKVLEPVRGDDGAEMNHAGASRRRASAFDLALAGAGLGLIALDIILLVMSRQPRRPR